MASGILIDQKVLLVGEGDFSFARSVCKQLHRPSNLWATSLDTRLELAKYSSAEENVSQLLKLGTNVVFGVDATKLPNQPSLFQTKFDRIYFNFPHAGRKAGVKKNQQLLSDFFLSAGKVLDLSGGEIHVTLCNSQGGTPADKPQRDWPNSWQVVAMAANAGFILCQVQLFELEFYEGYTCTGYRSQDKGFHTEGALQHIFVRSAALVKPDNSPIEKTINGKMVKFLCPLFFQPYINRRFEQMENHPVNLTKKYIEKMLVSRFSVFDIKMDDMFVIEGDAKLNHDHNHSIISCTPNNPHGENFAFYLRSSLLCSLKNMTFGPDTTAYFGRIFKFAEINPQVFPIEHQMLILFADQDGFSKIKDFIARLLNLINCPSTSLKIKYSRNSTCPCSTMKNCDSFEIEVIVGDLIKTVGSNISGEIAQGINHCCLLRLDALAMLLFAIEDIQLLWSRDSRVWGKFEERLKDLGADHLHSGRVLPKLEPFSLYPPSYSHDVSFWESRDMPFKEIEFFMLVRDVAENLVREVRLIDTFNDPISEMTSRCYRITYQACDVALSQTKAASLQMTLRLKLPQMLGVTLR